MLLTYVFYYPSKAPRSPICVTRNSFIPKSYTHKLVTVCTAGDAGNPCHSIETIPKGHSTIPAPAQQPGRALARQHPGQSCPHHRPRRAPPSPGSVQHTGTQGAHGAGCQAVHKELPASLHTCLLPDCS